MVLLVITFLAAVLTPGLADYACLCSYATDQPLYAQPKTTSNVIGHLYEFDCKPEYAGDSILTADWKAVMINHHIGYFKDTSAVSSEICQGNIPSLDKVTKGPSPTTTLTTSSKAPASLSNGTVINTSVTSSTSAPNSIKTHIYSSTPGTNHVSATKSSMGSSSVKSSPSQVSMGIKPASTSVMSLTTSKSLTTDLLLAQTSIPVSASSHISPSASTAKSSSLPTTVKRPSLITRVTTPQTPWPTTHKVQTPIATQKITPSTFITQTPNIAYKCPDNVIRASVHNHGRTRVYGTTCYELVPYYYQWFDAEANCKNKGGHLVHVQSMAEENNVMRFLYDNNFKHTIWLGLTDLHQENHFYWTSGDPVTFTKWRPGHINNFDNHHFEDCVVLVPYIKAGFLGSHGLWDDIHCNEGHPWVCQYNAEPVHSLSWHIFGNGGYNHGSHQGSGHNHLVFTTKTPVIGGLSHVLDIIGKK